MELHSRAPLVLLLLVVVVVSWLAAGQDEGNVVIILG